VDRLGLFIWLQISMAMNMYEHEPARNEPGKMNMLTIT
jgi:hypothetical protein